MQDGGDAFQGASAAAALEAFALVLALPFRYTAAVPDFEHRAALGRSAQAYSSPLPSSSAKTTVGHLSSWKPA